MAPVVRPLSWAQPSRCNHAAGITKDKVEAPGVSCAEANRSARST